MFKRAIPAIIIVAMACFSAFDMAAAQESQVIHFQGLLTGPDGGPLRTETYDINFSIWDHPTDGFEPVWSETQVVEVTEGLFDVFLGSVNALSADVFTPAEEESELRYLEIQVVGDDPMTPRTQIAKTPNSFVSSRVLGDVVTGPGSFRMIHPPGGPGVEMFADDISNLINFRLGHPPELPAVDILSDAGNSTISFRMIHPPEGPNPMPAVEMDVDAARTSFRMIDPGDDHKGFDVFIGGEGNSIKLMDPSNGEISLIEMNGGIGGDANFRMFNPQPEPPAVVMEMNTTQYGANLAMAAPGAGGLRNEITDPLFKVYVDTSGSSVQLMDPADPEIVGLELVVDSSGPKFKARFPQIPGQNVGLEILTSSTDPAGDKASIRMFNPQPEPPAEPLLEMNTTQYGANLAMAAPGGGGLLNEITNPMFEVKVDTSGSSVKMMDPADLDRVGLEMVVDSSGPNFRAMWFPPIPGEIPGVEIMTSSVGPAGDQASIRMFRPQPEPPAELLLEMNTNEYGANLAMAAPGGGGLRNEITDPMFEVNVDSDGGSLDIYDEIGKYMGAEPSPFMAGGGFYMHDPSTDQTNVWIESSGRLVARKGIFGHDNTNTGNYNLAVGAENVISGDNSFAGGRVAEVNHDNCFVWSDYPVGPAVLPTPTSGDNQFLVRSTGGVTFYSDANMNYGVYLAPGAYSWSSIIPPGPELNTRPVDGKEVLAKIERLPLQYYSHKDRENSVEHIGPVAGDFNSLFNLSQDDTHISTGDEAGVALAGVKELISIINDLKEENRMLERRISELERR